MLSALTNPDFVGGPSPKWFIPSKENIQKLYDHIVEAIQDPDVLLIKLLDFTTNGLRLDRVTDTERKVRLTKKYAPMARVFIRELAGSRPLNIMSDLRQQVLEQLWEEYAKMLGTLAVA